MQLRDGTDPIDVKISSMIPDLKPLHASWIVDLYRYLEEEKQISTMVFRRQDHQRLSIMLNKFLKVLRTLSESKFYTVTSRILHRQFESTPNFCLLKPDLEKSCFALLMAFMKFS